MHGKTVLAGCAVGAVMMVAAACSSGDMTDSSAASSPRETHVLETNTPQPSPTATPVPTATSVPPPSPTHTPAPAPTPTSDVRYSDAVIATYNAAATAASVPTQATLTAPLPLQFTGYGQTTTGVFRVSSSPWTFSWQTADNNSIWNELAVWLSDPQTGLPVTLLVLDGGAGQLAGSKLIYGHTGEYYLDIRGPNSGWGITVAP